MRVGPQQVATGQVRFSQVRVEQQRFLGSRERLLLQIPGLLGVTNVNRVTYAAASSPYATANVGIERDGALEQRDRSLCVDIGGADAEIPRAQHGIVRRGVDGGQGSLRVSGVNRP